MNKLLTAVCAASMFAAGCVSLKAPEKIDVNLNTDGGSGGGNGGADTGRPGQLPASGGGSWRDIATGAAGSIFLSAEKGVVFYAFDTLAYPGQPVDLVVSLQGTRDMKGLPGVTVGFFHGDDLLGAAETNEKGLAGIPWTPPKAGNYAFVARIVDVPEGVDAAIKEVSPAPLLVAAHDPKARLVILDLDHTVVDSSFFRVLLGGAKPMADSVKVTQRLANRYGIVYLTHRPDLLTRKSKGWLSENGYPAGPLLVSELKEAFGDSGKFKTAKLRDLRKAYPNVQIGIGDKLSDAQAYADNGLTAYLIPNCKDKPKDLRKTAQQLRGLKGNGRLNVVDGWQGIEAGIFNGRKYPPETFARELDARAAKLDRDNDEEDD